MMANEDFMTPEQFMASKQKPDFQTPEQFMEERQQKPNIFKQFLSQAESASAPLVRGAAPYAAGAAVGGMFGGPPGAIAGMGAVGLTDLTTSALRAAGIDVPSIQQLTQKYLTKAGVPESLTSASRIAETMVGAGIGGYGQASALGPVAQAMESGRAQRLLSVLSQAPSSQAAAGVSSGLASQATAELGGGPIAQSMAGLVGGMIPSLAAETPRALLRGTASEQAVQERISRARAAGIDPTLAYATPSIAAKSAQKVLGGTESWQAIQQKIVGQVESKASDIASQIGKSENPNYAGLVLQKALGAQEGGFIKNTKAIEDTLWNKVWDKLPSSAEMPIENTIKYLQGSQKSILGAENLSELMKDPKLASFLIAIQKDMNKPLWTAPGMEMMGGTGGPKGNININAIKQLRSLIGEKLEPGNLSPDVSRKALSGLYGALSEDIKGYMGLLGKDFERDFSRANKLTAGKFNRIDTYLQDIQNKKPYEVWRYATNPDAVENGGRQFLAINRSLEPAQRDVFHSTFIEHMGRDAGKFNPETFLKNYDRLDPMVKGAILPGKQRSAVDNVSKIISDMQKTGTFPKKDGSGPMFGAYLLLGGLLKAHPGSAMSATFTSSKAEKLVSALNSPGFIDYVAGINRIPPSQVANAMASLSVAIRDTRQERNE